MVSPCRTCAHRERSKNHPDCVNCPERQAAFDGLVRLENPVTKINGETKICSDPDCPHKGVAQPIDAFRRARYGRLNICSDCMKRRQAAGKKKAGKSTDKPKVTPALNGSVTVPDVAAEQAATPIAAIPAPAAPTPPPSNHHNFIVVDFEGRRDLLDGLRKKSDDDLRTPENMVMMLVKRFVEGYHALDRSP